MNFKFSASLLVLLTCALFFTSCEKPVPISASVVPGLDDLNNNTLDSFTINTKTISSDTVSTSFKKFILLGSMNDAIFGSTIMDAYMQPDLSTNNLSFPSEDAISLDSIVLTLDYAGYYGDTSVPISLTVHEILDPYTHDSVYNSYANISYSSNVIGALSNFTFKPTEDVVVGNDTLAAHLRIRLSDAWSYGFFSQSGGPNFTDATSFHNYLKGFYIKIDPMNVGRAACSFSRDGALTRLNVYYHSNTEDSLVYTFNFSSINGNTTNKYTHNYNGTLSPSMISDPCQNLTQIDNMCYVQSMQGTSMRVQFPYLTSIPDLIVNKAVLQVCALKDTNTPDSIYTLPSSLALDVIDTANNCNLSFTTFSLLKEETVNGKTYNIYTFDVGDEVQEIIRTDVNYTFVVSSYSQSSTFFGSYNAYNVNPHRVVLYGKDADIDFSPKLFVSYTLIQ